MARVIGAADDFYRLRVARLDDSAEPDLEWREDILWRDPPKDSPDERESWTLEAVRVDDEEALPIAAYESSDEAHAALEAIQEEMESLTKSQFEGRYLEG